MKHRMTWVARSTALVTAAVLLATCGSLVGPSAAFAKKPTKGYAPPGNSGVSQYVEDLPTASGSKPSSSVVIPTGGGSGRGGSGGGATSVGSSIPAVVSKQLQSDGSTGKQAVAVAKATVQAPSSGHVRPTKRATPAAPSGQVLSALDGSTGGGGLGVLLPVILIGSLVLASLAGLLRRRRSV